MVPLDPDTTGYRAHVVEREDPRWPVAADALDRAGAGPGEMAVVRDGHSLLIRRGEVVVRVRPRSQEPVAAREVAVALALAGAGVPITLLVSAEGQPWHLGSWVVTAWEWAEATGSAGPADLGSLAGLLRERTSGGMAYDVARFDPIAAIRGAVHHLPVGDAQAEAVRRLAMDAAPAWAAVADRDPRGTVIVHGDLHSDNVVATRSGPLLTDLELAGAGPPSYDAAPAALAVRRYGADQATFDQFAEAAGDDPRQWDGFAVCVRVYELWVTAWAVGVRHRSPELEREATIRIASLVDGNEARWQLH